MTLSSLLTWYPVEVRWFCPRVSCLKYSSQADKWIAVRSESKPQKPQKDKNYNLVVVVKLPKVRVKATYSWLHPFDGGGRGLKREVGFPSARDWGLWYLSESSFWGTGGGGNLLEQIDIWRRSKAATYEVNFWKAQGTSRPKLENGRWPGKVLWLERIKAS
jgi:hypothetical protein